jgi:hypothetical protein
MAPRSSNGAAGGAISPNDRTVLFTDPWDEIAVLYQVGQPAQIGTLVGTSTGITSSRFNATGDLLVTNGGDGDRVWNATSGQSLLVVSDLPANVAFGTDDRAIVSNAPFTFSTHQSYRQTFRCDVCGDFKVLLTLAHQRAGTTLTAAQRAQYLHS